LFQPTALFCEILDRFFDLFNSNPNKIEKDEKRIEKLPFGGKHLKEQKKILQETADFVRNMRKIAGRPLSKISKKQPPLFFQEGILRNCAALPLLLDELETEFPGEELLIWTMRLNQDLWWDQYRPKCIGHEVQDPQVHFSKEPRRYSAG
jgi:hypothetical protein